MEDKKDFKETQIEEMEILDPTPVEISVGFGKDIKTLVVKPLVLKNYKKLFALVTGILSNLISAARSEQSNEIKDMLDAVIKDPTKILDFMENVVMFGGDKITEFLADMLEVDSVWLDKNLDGPTLSKLLVVMYRQNDVEEIVRNFTLIQRMVQKNGHIAKIRQLLGEDFTQNLVAHTLGQQRNT